MNEISSITLFWIILACFYLILSIFSLRAYLLARKGSDIIICDKEGEELINIAEFFARSSLIDFLVFY